MSQLYPNARQLLATAALNLSSVTLAAALVLQTYVPAFATDANLSDLGANVAATANLAGVAVSSGILSANSVNFGAVTTASPVNAVVVYRNTGVAGTSTLVAYINPVTGLPATFTGGTVMLSWDTGANKIFVV